MVRELHFEDGAVPTTKTVVVAGGGCVPGIELPQRANSPVPMGEPKKKVTTHDEQMKAIYTAE